jgi:hypothetical protein
MLLARFERFDESPGGIFDANRQLMHSRTYLGDYSAQRGLQQSNAASRICGSACSNIPNDVPKYRGKQHVEKNLRLLAAAVRTCNQRRKRILAQKHPHVAAASSLGLDESSGSKGQRTVGGGAAVVGEHGGEDDGAA